MLVFFFLSVASPRSRRDVALLERVQPEVQAVAARWRNRGPQVTLSASL